MASCLYAIFTENICAHESTYLKVGVLHGCSLLFVPTLPSTTAYYHISDDFHVCLAGTDGSSFNSTVADQQVGVGRVAFSLIPVDAWYFN